MPHSSGTVTLLPSPRTASMPNSVSTGRPSFISQVSPSGPEPCMEALIPSGEYIQSMKSMIR